MQLHNTANVKKLYQRLLSHFKILNNMLDQYRLFNIDDKISFTYSLKLFVSSRQFVSRKPKQA